MQTHTRLKCFVAQQRLGLFIGQALAVCVCVCVPGVLDCAGDTGGLDQSMAIDERMVRMVAEGSPSLGMRWPTRTRAHMPLGLDRSVESRTQDSFP